MKIHLMRDKNILTLPVTPESYNLSTSQNNQTVNIVSLGDINLMGNKGLRELSFSSFFPGKKVHGGYQTQADFRPPFVLCSTISNWKSSKQIIRVIITGTNINMEFLINEFSYEQKDATGDVYYSISLSEYVRPKVTLKIGNVVSLAKNRSKKPNETQFYTVKKGDTLKKIAKAKLGSSSNFKKLAKINGISAPYKLKAGQVIKLK